nr:hypothetical protein [Tanacetum cinerariifolium]
MDLAVSGMIPEDVLLMLADKDTAKEAWETLRTMHMGAERVKVAKAQTLEKRLRVEEVASCLKTHKKRPRGYRDGQGDNRYCSPTSSGPRDLREATIWTH